MIYTVNVTLEVSANSEHDAYRQIERLVKGSKPFGWFNHEDSEVIARRPEEEDSEEVSV